MQTSTHDKSAGKSVPLRTREQTLLAELERRLRETDGERIVSTTRFKDGIAEGEMLKFQALLLRSGLLQTVLFALRKYQRGKEAKTELNANEKEKIFQALEVVGTLLHALRSGSQRGATEDAAQPKPPELFPVSKKGTDIRYIDPVALAKLDLIAYQRLQLEALEVAGLVARYADAIDALKDLDQQDLDQQDLDQQEEGQAAEPGGDA